MKNDDLQGLIDQLDTILEAERDALLSGDLEAIGRLLTRKEALIDALGAAEPDRDGALVPLQAKVDRNQVLLDSALQGIRRVAGRMAAFRRIRKTLETYDSAGRKTVLRGEVDRKVEKRA